MNIGVVFVENTNNNTFNTHMWPSSDTLDRLNALNQVAGTEFGWEDLFVNLNEILYAHGKLTPREMTTSEEILKQI